MKGKYIEDTNKRYMIYPNGAVSSNYRGKTRWLTSSIPDRSRYKTANPPPRGHARKVRLRIKGRDVHFYLNKALKYYFNISPKPETTRTCKECKRSKPIVKFHNGHSTTKTCVKCVKKHMNARRLVKLPRYYIGHLLNIPSSQVTPQLIELKTKQLKLWRRLKQTRSQMSLT